MEQIIIGEQFAHNGYSYEIEYVITELIIVAAATEITKQSVILHKYRIEADGLHYVPIMPRQLYDESLMSRSKHFCLNI